MSYLEMARESIDQGKIANAHKYLNLAGKSAGSADMRSKVQELVVQLESLAQEKLAEANQAYDCNEYPQAVEIYQGLARLTLLKVAEEAQKKLATFKDDPVMQVVLREMEGKDALAQAQGVLVDALIARMTGSAASSASPSTEDQVAVYDEDAVLAGIVGQEMQVLRSMSPETVIRFKERLDSVKRRFPMTEASVRAGELIDGIAGDAELSKFLQRSSSDGEAKSAYQMADLYMQAGLKDKAVEGYRQVATNWPTSSWAEKANAKLLSLEEQQ